MRIFVSHLATNWYKLRARAIIKQRIHAAEKEEAVEASSQSHSVTVNFRPKFFSTVQSILFAGRNSDSITVNFRPKFFSTVQSFLFDGRNSDTLIWTGSPSASMNVWGQPEKDNEDTDLSGLALSIEKSRKRQMSIGLLRGNQALDRLRVQEASASPILKKQKPCQTPQADPSPEPNYYSPTGSPPNNPASEMVLTMAEFKAYMDANTNKTLAATNSKLEEVDSNLGSLRSSVNSMESSVRGNSKRLDEQAVSIRTNMESIQKMQGELDKMKGGVPTTVSRTPAAWSPPRSTANDALFAKARRSLRLWPILGGNSDDLWHSAGIFLGTNLGLKGKLDKDSIKSISRVDVPSGPGVREEALVVFVSNGVRDLVMGSAAKLGPFVDSEGKPTAGMRIEVPAHLQREFRVLFKYGQNLRSRHGVGTRRHVKFDDLDSTLYLNAKLPGDTTWSKITVEVARRGLRAREIRSAGDLERRMDIEGPFIDRPRAASTSSAATSENASRTGSAWTTRRTESTS